ncbi:MAG: efflux RND transporter permease subunit [Acidobacteriota bacterium]|nr:efflux RND transporter permease subunit [Acidobacteriota bacterium]
MSRGEASLARFSLDRRVTVFVLFLTVVVVGLVAATGIPVELVPRGFDPPFLSLSVSWPDAPPREVLDKLVLPLEEEMATVRGMGRISSYAGVGRAQLWLQFKQATDMDVAYREVRDRIERARRRMPAEIDQVRIHKEDEASIPVLVLGVAVDPEVGDPYELLQRGLAQRLQRVEGVAAVTTDGLEEKEILIELDRRLVESAGLDLFQLGEQLAADNFTLPGGKVFDGGRRLLLRSVARYESLEDLRGRWIAPGVRLGEVATITYEEPKKNYRVRAMGKPAVAMVILKEGEANAREVSSRLAAVLEEIEQDPRLAGLEIITLFDQGRVIDESLDTMLGSGLVGGCLAALVLLFFLRRFRLTVIIALSIPLSLVLALTVMFFAGETLNILSLLGLMICVGLLVDNAVVVAENIHRLHQEGLDRREASIRGTGEIALAITMSTMTTIIAFLPAALVEGDARFFLVRLALPICVALAGSLLVALVFVPLCVYLTLPENAGDRPAGRLAGIGEILRRGGLWLYDHSLGPLAAVYDRLLARALGRRLELVLALAALFALTAAFPFGAALDPEDSRAVRFTDVQEEERSGLSIRVRMPADTTLEEAESWFRRTDQVLERHREQWDLDGYFHFHRSQEGEIQAWFKRPRQNELTSAEVTELFIAALPVRPGFVIHSGQKSQVSKERGDDTFSVILTGEDPERLENVALSLTAELVRIDGVIGARKAFETSREELGLVVDRDRARRYGAEPRVIAAVVGTALRGRSLPRYQDRGREVPVRIRFREADREELAELETFLVPSASGPLSLATLTDARPLAGAPFIYRENRRISRTITLDLAEEDREATRQRLAALVAGLALPEGVHLASRTQREDFDSDLSSLFFALGLSVIFIYLLMGFLFENIILPLSIVLTIPLAAIGVGWIHFLADRDIDFLGAVGIVLLVGVVVNNGIVLVDTIGRLRRQGLPRDEAVGAAARRRFRPIMMTAITTVGGMIPLAFAGTSSIGMSYTSFSLTLIGGMTSGTALTLLVVPVFYTFFDDATAASIRAWCTARSLAVAASRRQ